MHIARTVLIVFSFVFVSCKPERKVPSAPPTITSGILNGSIFIVRKNGESTKLGLVNVKLFSEEALSQRIVTKIPEVRDARLRVKSDIKRELEETCVTLDNIYEATRANDREKSRQAVQQLEQEMKMRARDATLAQFMQNHEQILQAKDFISPESKMALETKKEAVKTLKLIDSAVPDSFDEDYPERTIGYYFNDLPLEIDRALTDADGRFTLKIPKPGKFAIFAESSRQIGNKKETYYWLVSVSMNESESKELLLSNHNLVKEETLKLFTNSPAR